MYECLNDFKSQKINKNYKYGDIISEAEYYTLESFERLKFRKNVSHYSEESFKSKNDDFPTFFDNSLNEISETYSYNNSSSNDTSSNDFGGGSFDGGGSGGDW